jgi:hypothetical protein
MISYGSKLINRLPQVAVMTTARIVTPTPAHTSIAALGLAPSCTDSHARAATTGGPKKVIALIVAARSRDILMAGKSRTFAGVTIALQKLRGRNCYYLGISPGKAVQGRGILHDKPGVCLANQGQQTWLIAADHQPVRLFAVSIRTRG